MSYKVLFPDPTFHIIIFLKKYGTLSGLLEGPATREITVNSPNTGQISFIISLMHGYNGWELYGIKELKSILTKAKTENTKKNPKKGIKCFFLKKFNEFISKKQTNFSLNAIQL